jgi:hypothetical protein
MSNTASNPNLYVVPDMSALRSAERRDRAAARIAERALSKFDGGQLSAVVRGGRLGLANTFHQADVYDIVAQRLLEAGIEVTVHSITQTKVPALGVICQGVTAHIVSAATVEGWPRYNPLSPVSNPSALVGDTDVHEVEQVYPPQS